MNFLEKISVYPGGVQAELRTYSLDAMTGTSHPELIKKLLSPNTQPVPENTSKKKFYSSSFCQGNFQKITAEFLVEGTAKHSYWCFPLPKGKQIFRGHIPSALGNQCWRGRYHPQCQWWGCPLPLLIRSAQCPGHSTGPAMMIYMEAGQSSDPQTSQGLQADLLSVSCWLGSGTG